MKYIENTRNFSKTIVQHTRTSKENCSKFCYLSGKHTQETAPAAHVMLTQAPNNVSRDFFLPTCVHIYEHI